MLRTQQTLQSIKSLIDLREKINQVLGAYSITPIKIDQKESVIEIRLSGLDKVIFNQNQKEIIIQIEKAKQGFVKNRVGIEILFK